MEIILSYRKFAHIAHLLLRGVFLHNYIIASVRSRKLCMIIKKNVEQFYVFTNVSLFQSRTLHLKLAIIEPLIVKFGHFKEDCELRTSLYNITSSLCI